MSLCRTRHDKGQNAGADDEGEWCGFRERFTPRYRTDGFLIQGTGDAGVGELQAQLVRAVDSKRSRDGRACVEFEFTLEDEARWDISGLSVQATKN